MPWLLIAGAAVSLIGGISARNEAQDAADEEARLEGVVTAEKLRQMTVEEQIERSRTRAGYAASGVDVTVGSPLQVLSNQAAEYGRLRRGVAQAGATRAGQAQLRGQMTGDRALWGGVGNALNILGSANWG